VFEKDPAILSVAGLQSMQLGPDEVLLTAAVQFRRGMRIDEVEAAIERLEKAVMALFPAIRHIYFESGALRSAMS
jgi:divalent metal cation (Fe/Co/Zn/Cd) transporter